MTFQRSTARRIISLIRSIKPDTTFVVGGYDPSLAPEAWIDPSLGVDFIVRGEGDLTFRDLLRALEGHGSLSNIPFTLTVTDTATGTPRVYRNPPRTFASRGDPAAF